MASFLFAYKYIHVHIAEGLSIVKLVQYMTHTCTCIYIGTTVLSAVVQSLVVTVVM